MFRVMSCGMSVRVVRDVRGQVGVVFRVVFCVMFCIVFMCVSDLCVCSMSVRFLVVFTKSCRGYSTVSRLMYLRGQVPVAVFSGYISKLKITNPKITKIKIEKITNKQNRDKGTSYRYRFYQHTRSCHVKVRVCAQEL